MTQIEFQSMFKKMLDDFSTTHLSAYENFLRGAISMLNLEMALNSEDMDVTKLERQLQDGMRVTILKYDGTEFARLELPTRTMKKE